jgi:hypothetical protein
MVQLPPTTGPTRLVAPIPGVPETQAKALDRRRRLHRQLLSFKATERATEANLSPPITEPAAPDPA